MEISISSAQAHNTDTTPVLSELELQLDAEADGVRVSALDPGEDPPLYQITVPANGGTVVLTLNRDELGLLGDRITTAVFDA